MMSFSLWSEWIQRLSLEAEGYNAEEHVALVLLLRSLQPVRRLVFQ